MKNSDYKLKMRPFNIKPNESVSSAMKRAEKKSMNKKDKSKRR